MNQPARIQIPVTQLPPPAANEEDRIGREDRAALVCCHEPAYIEFLTAQLRGLGYKVHHAASHQAGVQKLAGRVYHLIVLLENLEGCYLDSNALLRHLTLLPTDERRATFLVLLCQTFKTGDEWNAYAQSVDLLVNYADVGNFNALVGPALEEQSDSNRHFEALSGRAA